ncbi:MAG: YceI family protein [Gemmatimonadetes bacterium]|nr:YceI family protein [Gemmatimonadota bacterium]
MTATATNRTTTWAIDPSHTLVEFSAKHLMISTVKGRFAGVSGTIGFEPGASDRATVDVTIDAATIDTRTDQRDQHLRSADFLDVESHPAITFKASRVEGAIASAGDQFRVIGDLTIRGVTKSVTLDATFEGASRDPWGNERVGFSATGRIDRREFGLVWNQALETGGVLVGTDIKLAFEVEAIRQA